MMYATEEYLWSPYMFCDLRDLRMKNNPLAATEIEEGTKGNWNAPGAGA